VAIAIALAVAVALALFGGAAEDSAPAASGTPPLAAPGPKAATPPEPTPKARAATGGAIPERYHGVWDAVSGSCDPASDLRVEISGRRMVFYESVGEVTGMDSRGSDAVADLAMEGEGETWSRSLRMTLSGESGEQRPVLADALETAQGNPIPLKRCPS
jgi:hypothetical protein